MKTYFMTLSENATDQVLGDLKAFGASVIHVSRLIPNHVTITTTKTPEELGAFFLVESFSEIHDATLGDIPAS